jgi:prepilin-type N-terminal cleavage/methylation domain-containing protein
MRRSPHTGRAPRSLAGFTLLEVLAAVAVLALTYSMLATAAMQGLRAEGDATRRMRASMLADQRITELEVQVAMGQAPDIGTHESQEEDFLVTTEVKPLDLVIADTKASKRAADRLDRAVGAKEKGKEAQSFLKPSGKDKQSMLRRIDLKVAWAEGESEQIVTRSTFALDTVAAAPLIETLVAAAEAEKAANGAANGTKTGTTTPNAETNGKGANTTQSKSKNAQQLRASESNSSSSMGSSKDSSSSSFGTMKRSTQGMK